MRPGFTIWGLDTGGHLWIVLSEVTTNGHVAVANFTTHDQGKRFCSSECAVVEAEEFAALDRPSCVFFREAWLTDAERLQLSVDDGTFRSGGVVPDTVLVRLQQAALDSRLTPRGVKTAIRQDT